MLVGYKNNNITRAKRTLANWEYLFTFLKYEGVEPTNNIAEHTIPEHTIRPSVQWRKICFSSQSDTGLRFTERLLSVVGICGLHGVNPYHFLTKVINASFNGYKKGACHEKAPDHEPEIYRFLVEEGQTCL